MLRERIPLYPLLVALFKHPCQYGFMMVAENELPEEAMIPIDYVVEPFITTYKQYRSVWSPSDISRRGICRADLLHGDQAGQFSSQPGVC